MPRYFFHVQNGYSSPDRDGTVLSCSAEARRMAIKLAGEILRDEAEKMDLGTTWRLDVVDQAQASVFAIEVQFDRPGSDRQLN
ncbi:DUF6894 family protein [Methylobacterium sp. A49B]